MNLDLVNDIFNNLKENKFVQNFINELSKYLENNKNNLEHRKEGHLYMVTEEIGNNRFLWDLTDAPEMEFEEKFISKDLLEKAAEGMVLKYTNGKYEYYSDDGFERAEKIHAEKLNKDKTMLTNDEEIKFSRDKFKFLQNYFIKELSNLEKGEIFIVTNKYENDIKLHRYKVAQYKNNFECKYIAFEKDLPENVKLGDVVRKIDGKYIYDEQATKYVNDSIKQIKEDIINSRNKKDGS